MWMSLPQVIITSSTLFIVYADCSEILNGTQSQPSLQSHFGNSTESTPKTEQDIENSTTTPPFQHIEHLEPLPKGFERTGVISRFMSLSFGELPKTRVNESTQEFEFIRERKEIRSTELPLKRKIFDEEKRAMALQYEPYQILISKIGNRGKWGSYFTCGYPGVMESVIYSMRNDKVTGLKFRCKNPKNNYPLLLPDSTNVGAVGINDAGTSNHTVFDLSCSHWGALEVDGINFVYDNSNEVLNVGRRCKHTEPKEWAIGTSTRSKRPWGKAGLVCPNGSRIWEGQIKEGNDLGNTNDSYVSGVILACYIPKQNYDIEKIIETYDTNVSDGNWSEWKLCDKYSYAHSIRLRYGSFVKRYGPSKSFSSASRTLRYLNAIEIGCIAPGNSTIQWLEIENKGESSKETWMKEQICDGLITDVNLQVRKDTNESFSDTSEVFDKIAGIGLSSSCSSGRGGIGYYMGDDIGTWLKKTPNNQCPDNFAVCGIRYKSDDSIDSSKIGISKIQCRCCPVMFPKSCTPLQHWELLTTVENNGTLQTFHFFTKWENGLFFPKLVNYIELKFKLYLHDVINPDGWINEPYESFTAFGKSYTQPYKGESGTNTNVYQLIGECEEMPYIRVKSTRLKFITTDKEGNYLYNEYN